jgi:hypothetical protein
MWRNSVSMDVFIVKTRGCGMLGRRSPEGPRGDADSGSWNATHNSIKEIKRMDSLGRNVVHRSKA